ncbi:MAG: hypothetical protein ACE366_11840 [Bradymonadia bacterium]
MIKRRTAVAALGLAALSAGCAEERPAINRVQPFALEKSHFIGQDFLSTADDPEFYTQATLIDVGYGASQDGLFTSTYAQPLSRIKWQVTEDQLIARIAYERIEGSDGKGLGGPTQDGVIAAVFRIESHFDIINQYNPTTGEKLNIINENTTDRPWYEREYFRVDWSQNLSGETYDFDTLSLLGLYGGLRYEPLKYDITDPNDPDAPQFGDLEDGYFDITVKAFAKPELIDLSHFGWGIDSFPSCFLDPDFLNGTGPAASCNPVELTIRHSFRRVVPNDYQPAHWDGLRFQAYGAFTVDRKGYTRKYGMTDEQWRRFINRYNIWERSHYYEDLENMVGPVECFTPETTPYGQDANRDTDGNGTADECEAVTDATGFGGSQCDTFTQKCTLPYRARDAKPIVWYYTEASDPEYFEPTTWSTRDWDSAFRAAVQTARYSECVRTGGDAGACKSDFPMYDGQMDDHTDLKQIMAEVIACEKENGWGTCDSTADRLGEARGAKAEVIAIAKMDPMVVLCHSPVEHGDHPYCGTADQRLPEGISHTDCADAYLDPEGETFAACQNALTVRMGDIRYHQINVIPTPQTPSPWGIMVDAIDPLTGESISASANVWSHVNDLWSAKVIDMIRYSKGELTTEEVTEAEYVRDWARAASAASGGGVAGRYTSDEVNQRVNAFSRDLTFDPEVETPDFDANRERAELPADVMRKARMLKKDIAANVRADLLAPGQVQAFALARANQAKGTTFEAELMTPMMQELMGVDGLGMTDSVLDASSILRAGNPAFQRQMYRLKEKALADRGSCIYEEAPAPMSLTGMGDMLEAKFGQMSASDDPAVQLDRAERMRTYLKRKAHYAVMSHEMGHSVGLRHNFVSSSNAYHYRPQYWQLRTKNGTITEDCTGVTRDGENCIGPRYFDPMTAEERDNLIWMWMHSSMMDYAGEYSQDMLGLSAYDYAATRMFYGDTVAVFADDSYKADTYRGLGMIGKQDNFGGILGYDWEGSEGEIHYSALNREYDLIQNCRVVNPDDYKPQYWNEELDGAWHPTLDGLLVQVDGQFSVCDQQTVDYVAWNDLQTTDGDVLQQGGIFPRGGPTVDGNDRVRVPYGFATDRWADLGNAAVYRHDNGADQYELFDFFITQQEVGHIWDNYRRGRQTFSIRGAANRTLGRYNGKIRDAAKGLGLLKNIYRDFSLDLGYNFAQFWPQIAPDFFKEPILASGLAFDHFTRAFARPAVGGHYYSDFDQSVLRSEADAIGNIDADDIVVSIPNGATGYLETVGIGGKPVENALAEGQGEYDAEFTINAGSYYDKIWTPYLMAESEDNFISDSRRDFVDARYRAVSLAELYPDGFRRWLANNLTGDDAIKGMRLWSDPVGRPFLDDKGFPDAPMGYVSWWGETPRVCFPNDSTTLCTTFGNESGANFNPDDPEFTAVLDPQIGWEQQKFLVAWTLMYLPANQEQSWIDMMRVWELGVDNDPGFDNRIEFHNPTGKVYVAKAYGTEQIFGKTVQRGIAARVLEYANELLAQAYVVDDGPDLNNDGTPDWYIPVMNANTGEPLIQWDPSISAITEEGFVDPEGSFGCNASSNANCTCEANRACMALRQYVSLPFFMREAISAYGLGNPNTKGIWD